MRGLWWILLVLPALAGCADGPGVTAGPDDEECDCYGDATGAIRGVVVDEAVVPVEGATVTLLGEGISTLTDEGGMFTFADLSPGVYFVNVTSLTHEGVQVSVEVVAGVEPAITRVQVARLFEGTAFVDQQQIQGFINCGYSAYLRSPCIIDYTQLACPGGCAPILYGISGDVRRFIVPVDDGWQSRINEMVWEPSTGTSPSLSMTVSFYNRTTSHSYDGAAGVSPLRHQMDVKPDVGHPEWIPEEGLADYLVFVNPHTEGSDLPVALVLSQGFELFSSTFYYGLPPEGWSFMDGNPF